MFASPTQWDEMFPQVGFLARVLAKTLKMLFSTLSAALIKISTFSMFLISDEIIIEIYHQIFNFQIFFDPIESDLSKTDQNGSKLIRFDFCLNNHWKISLDF